MVILETLVQDKKKKQNNYLKPKRTENNINTL